MCGSFTLTHRRRPIPCVCAFSSLTRLHTYNNNMIYKQWRILSHMQFQLQMIWGFLLSFHSWDDLDAFVWSVELHRNTTKCMRIVHISHVVKSQMNICRKMHIRNILFISLNIKFYMIWKIRPLLHQTKKITNRVSSKEWKDLNEFVLESIVHIASVWNSASTKINVNGVGVTVCVCVKQGPD